VTDLQSQFGTYVGQAIIPIGQAVEVKANEVLSLGQSECFLDAVTGEFAINPFSYTFHSSQQIYEEDRVERMRARLNEGYNHLTRNVDTIGERLLQTLECSICLEFFESACVLPKCSHRFCYKCIAAWVIREGGDQCPLCRTEIMYMQDQETPLLTLCCATEDIFRAVVDPYMSLELVSLRAFLTESGKQKLALSKDVLRCRLRIPDKQLSLRHVEGLETRQPTVAGRSVTHSAPCLACKKIIPSFFERLVCHQGLPHEVHIHGSYPCYLAAAGQIKAYSDLIIQNDGIDKLGAQTARHFDTLLRHVLLDST
jgi:hypothetical protein